jgi:hypothetical protein
VVGGLSPGQVERCVGECQFQSITLLIMREFGEAGPAGQGGGHITILGGQIDGQEVIGAQLARVLARLDERSADTSEQGNRIIGVPVALHGRAEFVGYDGAPPRW